MYKYIFSILALIFALAAAAQNVGIGTETPMQKLDVNGNINMQGHLHVNNNAGRPGQVLMVNADGTQNWANAFGYKNRKTFNSDQIFNVPPGITEIMIEAVGAGGGGAKAGGGAGGAYVIGIYKVVPGQVLTIHIGAAGTGALLENNNGSPGQTTSVLSSTFVNIQAYGGGAAEFNSAGDINRYSFAAGDSAIYTKVLDGGRGTVTTESYSQYNSTTFVTSRYYGNGGVSAFNPWYIPTGGFLSFNTATLFNIKLYYPYNFFPGAVWGTGGCAGNMLNGNWGGDGAPGLVAISW